MALATLAAAQRPPDEVILYNFAFDRIMLQVDPVTINRIVDSGKGKESRAQVIDRRRFELQHEIGLTVPEYTALEGIANANRVSHMVYLADRGKASADRRKLAEDDQNTMLQSIDRVKRALGGDFPKFEAWLDKEVRPHTSIPPVIRFEPTKGNK